MMVLLVPLYAVSIIYFYSMFVFFLLSEFLAWVSIMLRAHLFYNSLVDTQRGSRDVDRSAGFRIVMLLLITCFHNLCCTLFVVQINIITKLAGHLSHFYFFIFQFQSAQEKQLFILYTCFSFFYRYVSVSN